MPNIVHVQYNQTGQSKSNNAYGMRQIQERAFEYRDAQYLLIKSPIILCVDERGDWDCEKCLNHDERIE